ncbi:hypothetical protein L798_14568 [Zootermopsis nevadensis]|uniref:Uncharacterized protein n=1 Tax=Zootermopsis nevadensis TaxID=136037 RepID=A0A067QPT9_ZOONE|nr:hypothetical protein L798_14568 [Zootermopsis nevadensis]
MIDEDIFGVGVTMLEEIDIDQAEEAKQYALRLHERIRRMDEDVVGAAVSSSSSEKTSSTLTFSDDSYEGDIPEAIYVKEFNEFDVEGKVMVVPNFRDIRKTKEWRRVLDHHENRLKRIVTNLMKINNNHQALNEIQRVKEKVMQVDCSRIKDKTRRDLAQRTMYVGLSEDVILRELGSLAFHFKDLECMIDDATNGLWVEELQDDRGREIINNLSTDRIVLTRRYKFRQQFGLIYYFQQSQMCVLRH